MAAFTVQPVTVPVSSPCIFLNDVPPETRREDMPDFTLAQATTEELLVAQLSRLASQHHTSEYNRVKFGRCGTSATYVPLCLYMPEQFKQLRSQQARYVLMQAWWPCPKRDIKRQTSALVLSTRSREPSICRPPGMTDLQEDLRAAIASPFIPPVPTAPPPIHTFIKTSDTHPINISSIVPAELLPIISAHVSQADHLSHVMFNVPLSFQLHRLISQSADMSSAARGAATRGLDSLALKAGMPSTVVSRATDFTNLFWNQTLLCSTLVPNISGSKPQLGKTQLNSILSSFPPLRTRTVPRSTHATTTNQPQTASPRRARPTSISCRAGIEEPGMFSSCKTEMQIECTDDDPLHWRGVTSYLNSSNIVQTPSSRSISSTAWDVNCDTQPHGFTLGNLLLSSCPGKKVRVDGPVDGRSGVRRDIYQDMKRIKEFGAGCLVCCLDDDELQLLGAPWDEYARIAHGLGLDILRLPIPEGLAPADIEVFDSHLQRIINSYTLCGISVLVHCRGGIGRAGLVACCWIIKLGLCGSIDTQPGGQPNSRLGCRTPVELSSVPPDAIVSREILELLERVITLVRRRRSLKAIETFEQVKFLVEYVEFLRSR